MSLLVNPAARGFAIYSYSRYFRRALSAELTPVLTDLYPDGGKWLQRRLDDVESGSAAATVVARGAQIAGVTIETPKEIGRLKLSTLWVHPSCRRIGIGSAMLGRGRKKWIQTEASRVDLTCAASAASGLAPLLHRSGFLLESLERNRYGEGRHEFVFSWRPDMDPSQRPVPTSLVKTGATAG